MIQVTDHDIDAIRNGDEKYLCDATLRNADLRVADLRVADLRGADLRNATLRNADLCDATLCDATLRGADLCDATLRNADLRVAYLSGADLRGADLSGADLPPEVTPESGAFEAYKATEANVLHIRIPADAERLSALGSRKCRASEVEVLEVLGEDGGSCDETEASGWHDSDFVYVEGETAYPDEYDDDRRVDCSHGIHFFMTKDEAIEWG